MPVRMGKPIKQMTAHAGENVELEKHSSTFSSHYGMNLALPWETDNRSTLRPIYSHVYTPRTLDSIIETLVQRRSLLVHS